MQKFHRFYLEEIKKKSKASFCGWETENNKTRLKLIIDGETKYLNLTGDFSGVNVETYCQLLNEFM
ncbi:MAG TPA: hypothetical protein VLA48_03030 [Nitrososphaeraceae archaeon]|nr:hypothetical protein [Nitrososphaeraceae archaeon]